MSKSASAAVCVGALCVAGGLAATARTPEAGLVWRGLFVAVSLGGGAVLFLLLRHWEPSVRMLLGVAVAIRLIVLPLSPTLSDDGYRYVWDGAVQAQLVLSPYAHRPTDPEVASLRDEEVYTRLNSPDYFSVYPPASQLVFWLGGQLVGGGWHLSWLAIKAVLVVAELVGILALIRLVGPRGAALYAWHPLAVVEVAGQGHTEGLLIGALGVFLVAVRRYPSAAATSLAWAGWVKLYPFALVPLLMRRPRALLVFGAAAAALAVPYASASAVEHVLESVGLYFGTFDFYAAPYAVLKSVLYLFADAGAGLLASRWLGIVWAAAVGWFLLTDDGTAGTARRITVAVPLAYAVTTTTLHPWHLLPVLFVIPLLQFATPLLWLATVSTATYLTYVWPPAHAATVWVGWAGAAALAIGVHYRSLLDRLMQLRAQSKWNRVQPFLPQVRPGGRLLDLGAGEGWVGALAAADRGLALTAADVVRYPSEGPRARTVDLYDGRRLPYPDGAFDATLLVFVLHHASAPREVVREALRVTSGPVLVLETVALTPSQKKWLERVDRWVNRLRSGGAIDEEPLDIRPDAEWRRLFRDLGAEVDAVRVWGGLHPQALYRLGHGATAASRESAVAERASTQRASS